MGAPQSRLYETARGLQERGWQVLVITAMPNYPTGKIFTGYKGVFSKKDEVKGISVHRYTLYASHSKKSIPRIISMLSFCITAMCSVFRIRRFKPGYIITESPPLTLGLTGLALARLSGARHIMNVSDIWPLSALRLGALSEGFIYRQLEKLEHFLYKNSYACMGQSAEITERLALEGSKRTLLFRNGVDFDRFEKLHEEAERQKNTPALRIVYAGLLGLAQGMADICSHIDFAAAGAELHIYGDGSEREEIEEYVGKNPGRGVVLHKPVSREEIPSVLVHYDVTLIPLITPIYGAIPSKIYEAMAAGLPVIFSGGGEGEAIINKYDTGWTCTPGNYSEITDRIKMVAALSAEELRKKRNNCLAAAKHTFDREIQIENLHSFLTAGKVT